MELNYTEISKEVVDNNSPSLQYWEKNKLPESQSKFVKSKKKKVSFDDILSNMNLVVNQNGILQHMSSNPEPVSILKNTDISQQSVPYSKNNINYNQGNIPIQVQKQEPIDPNVKHSYIYNKYFKDYHDVNAHVPLIRVPKTIEEYKQMLLEDKLKSIEQRNRIAQIKSKKLLFTNNVSTQRGIPVSNNNNLRNMKFF